MRLPACLALLLVLSGCSTPSQEGGQGSATEPGVITDPEDVAGSRTGEHVHDYWKGQDSVEVLDAEQPVFWNLVAGQGYWTVRFDPPDGSVVPQGAARVDVTVDWADGSPADHYGRMELLVKTARMADPEALGPLENGATVELETVYEDADLPHQTLSSWQFLVRIFPEQTSGAFTGAVHVKATAVRGLELRPFPAHPDLWGNKTERPLVDREAFFSQVRYGDGFTGYVDIVLRPLDGALVPPDAAGITLELTAESDVPTGLRLQYHGADTRAYTTVEPIDVSGNTQHYEIELDGNGDGPYGNQSLWEFRVQVARPLPADAGAYHGSLKLTGFVHRY